ncbi:MAG: DUF2231 domain-containing protein [Chloroflexota bacterium]|nr:DUF2231 domain-containing protein [Chloroflexota bacterium]
MILHPAIVHFPIALLIVSVVLDAFGVGFRRASLTQAGFYTLIGGSLGATAAVLTGPEHDAKDAAALTILHRHELFAALMVLCCLILVGMRLGNVNGLYGAGAGGYLALGVVLIVCIVLTGYFGGQLVYDHGVGVNALQGARIPAGDAVQEMWAKLGGIALVVVIVGWTIARSRFLTIRLRAWWEDTRSGTSNEQPTLWTLGLRPAGSEEMQAAASTRMARERDRMS